MSAAFWFAATAVTFADNPHLGTWKLDESKSTFAPGATKNHTVTYTEANDGMITLTVDGTDKDGKPIHWTWTGKFDGKPYRGGRKLGGRFNRHRTGEQPHQQHNRDEGR